MNSNTDRKLYNLYEGFMSLTAGRQKAVVETAQNLLEAQREIELLMENIRARALRTAGTGKTASGGEKRAAGCDKTRRLPTANC
jgi:hypothetical protein